MPKHKSDNRTVEIKMDDKFDIQTDYYFLNQIKFLSTKRNDYGTGQLLQVLDEKQLGVIFKLAEENLKMPVWKYNEHVI